MSYFKAFESEGFIHNNGKENLGKFDIKSDEGIFVGYFSICKAYRVCNERTEFIEKSIHVVFDETNIGLGKVVHLHLMSFN